MIATISAKKYPHHIELHFRKAEPVQAEYDESVYDHIRDIRTYHDVFGEVGFPQLSSLTRINGLVYGLIWTTKVDLPPESLVTITDPEGKVITDPEVLEEHHKRIRHRTGVSSTFGSGFGGVNSSLHYDSAALVVFEGLRPRVIKVYDLARLPAEVSQMYLQDVIYQYAYRDLMKITSGDTCATLLSK